MWDWPAQARHENMAVMGRSMWFLVVSQTFVVGMDFFEKMGSF